MATCDTNVINIKVGSAVILYCVYQDATGTPLSLDGITIHADFIHPKTSVLLKATGTDAIGGITITDMAKGEYTINAGSSDGWPKGEMPTDILYTENGNPQHTEDFILDFDQGRTGSIKATPTG